MQNKLISLMWSLKFQMIIIHKLLQVPSFKCELRVTDLIPGEKYIYAVAAYTDEGKLIGNSVGESTRPILASHPLPVLMAWAYLSQVKRFFLGVLSFCLNGQRLHHQSLQLVTIWRSHSYFYL